MLTHWAVLATKEFLMSDRTDDASVGRAYLVVAGHQLLEATAKIEHCLNQLSDEQMWWRPTRSQNSIANLLLHLCGNVRQWIISGVGGEPDIRRRPTEFSEQGPISKAELLRRLDDTVQQAARVLKNASTQDLLKHRRIQGSDRTGLTAIFDSVAHFQGHTQEIICLTRMQLGEAYQFNWSPSTPEEGAA
jgi:uncharacterized damage-inducible protein DinB